MTLIRRCPVTVVDDLPVPPEEEFVHTGCGGLSPDSSDCGVERGPGVSRVP